MLVNIPNIKNSQLYASKNISARTAYTDSMNMRELGLRVLLSRRDLGMEQGQLAERSHVSQSYISRLEHGKAKTISVEIIHALAEVLEVSASYLIGETDDPLANVEETSLREGGGSHKLDPLDEELLEIVQQFDHEQKRTFLQFARTILRPNKPRVIGGE